MTHLERAKLKLAAKNAAPTFYGCLKCHHPTTLMMGISRCQNVNLAGKRCGGVLGDVEPIPAPIVREKPIRHADSRKAVAGLRGKL